MPTPKRKSTAVGGSMLSAPNLAPDDLITVSKLVYGSYELRPWYKSLYPKELLSSASVAKLFVCPTCFKYSENEAFYHAHRSSCEFKEYPPGEVIYEKDEYTIFELDGEEEPVGV